MTIATQPRLPPMPDDLVVRYLQTDALDRGGLAARARRALSAEERETLARSDTTPAERDHLVAQALLRSVLAERAGCEPTALRFRSAPDGTTKPVWPPAASDLHFSVSHGDSIALCAVARGADIGTDVESLRDVARELGHDAGASPLALADRYCSAGECAQVQAAPPEARAERFLAIWSLKEAIARAIGGASHLAFADFTIGLRGEGRQPSVTFRPGAAGRSITWRLISIHPSPRHIAAVAIGTHGH